MAVPKKRTSKSRKGMRRAHDKINFTAAVMVCPSCGELKLMHRVCESCGTYRGKQILDLGGEAEASESVDFASDAGEEAGADDAE